MSLFDEVKFTNKKQRYSIYIKAIIIIAFFNELYFYPFGDIFRFSAGVILLNAIVLIYDKLSVLKLSICAGLLIVVLRITGSYYFHDLPFLKSFTLHIPPFAFYIIYGIGHTYLKYCKNKIHTAIYFIAFISIEIIANISELLIRDTFAINTAKMICFVAIIRTACAYALSLFIKQKNLYILNTAHQKRYAELNQLFSNIQSEIFYLKKSNTDIENIMRNSYELYQELANNQLLSERALSISRDIHEVKKDYSRVISGFEYFFINSNSNKAMHLSNAFDIIQENMRRFIENSRLEFVVELDISLEKDYKIINPYSIFTIVNNLITNSIESAKADISIQISSFEAKEKLYLKVIDTGIGISEDIKPLLFHPGFTTKFGIEEEKQSSGMGLPHVKSTLDFLEGDIQLISSKKGHTEFQISIPKINIVEEMI